jgi:5'-methylthioadenosine phosphorylase
MDGLEDTRTHRIVTPFGDPSDAIVTGSLGGVRVAFLARHGRGHRFTPSEVNYRANLFALKSLGVQQTVGISACGSLRSHIHPGDVVIPNQLFDFTKTRDRSFFGGGLVVHLSAADPFCARLSERVAEATEGAGGSVHRGGCFITIEGPRFSTKGESQVFRQWGMDMIGMTTSPEAFLAREAEMCYAVMAHVTDYDVWHEAEEPVSVETLLNTLAANTTLAQDALRRLVPALASEPRTCTCASALAGAIITAQDHIPRDVIERLSPIAGHYID